MRPAGDPAKAARDVTADTPMRRADVRVGSATDGLTPISVAERPLGADWTQWLGLAAVAVASALRFLIPAGTTAVASLLALALALTGILAASALAASHVREGVLGMARVWARRP